MIRKALQELKEYVSFAEDLLNRQAELADALSGYEDMLMKEKTIRSGRKFYYAKKKGSEKFTYIGKSDSPEVIKIKEAHYLKKSIPVLRKNIRLVNHLLEGYVSSSAKSINQMMPRVYTVDGGPEIADSAEAARKWKDQMEAYKATFPVYKPEELKVRTRDGSYVRSISEGMIYNLLLSLGVTFVYELPLKVGNRLYRPDFTILSEIDYETSYPLEHFGMMGDGKYKAKNLEKIVDYLEDGYVPGVNIFYTFGDMRGGLDISPIYDIIRSKIRPGI